MVVKDKLDFFKFHKLSNTAIANREIIQQLQCFGDNLLTPPPVFQVSYSVKNSVVTKLVMRSFN